MRLNLKSIEEKGDAEARLRTGPLKNPTKVRVVLPHWGTQSNWVRVQMER